MLLFSINRSRGYENPSLDIIVTERCSIGGCPLEEACEHCYLIQVLFLFRCYFCCYFVYHFCVLWRLCWIFYCYSVISSISFLFCIFYISGILQVVSEHFPWQKLWVFFFRVETYSDIFKLQRYVVMRINSWSGIHTCKKYKWYLSTHLLATLVTPVGTPSSGSALDSTVYGSA